MMVLVYKGPQHGSYGVTLGPLVYGVGCMLAVPMLLADPFQFLSLFVLRLQCCNGTQFIKAVCVHPPSCVH